MYTLACADLGTTCDFVAKAETQEEVLTQGMEHAASAHADTLTAMKGAMSDDEFKAVVAGKIKQEEAEAPPPPAPAA